LKPRIDSARGGKIADERENNPVLSSWQKHLVLEQFIRLMVLARRQPGHLATVTRHFAYEAL
jgi:hypothetical protein